MSSAFAYRALHNKKKKTKKTHKTKKTQQTQTRCERSFPAAPGTFGSAAAGPARNLRRAGAGLPVALPEPRRATEPRRRGVRGTALGPAIPVRVVNGLRGAGGPRSCRWTGAAGGFVKANARAAQRKLRPPPPPLFPSAGSFGDGDGGSGTAAAMNLELLGGFGLRGPGRGRRAAAGPGRGRGRRGAAGPGREPACGRVSIHLPAGGGA